MTSPVTIRFSQSVLQDGICKKVIWWRSWLRHCATSCKVTGTALDGVIGPKTDSTSSRNEY
jgi:hypothetical protein